jgi:DNA-binding transcriptional regulator/RsmH inhibitor MraZ
MEKESNIIRLDKLGRIRLSSALRRVVEASGEGEVFVSSTDDRTIKIYPLAAWHARVGKLFKEKKDDPLLRQFLVKANYNGQMARVDGFGRIRIPALLRRKIKQEGEIVIEERKDHMELKPA